MKQYNKLLISVLLLSTMILFSCNDDNFLSEKAQDFLSSELAYSDASGVKLGINGLHDYFRTNSIYGNDACTLYMNQLTDVCFNGEQPASSQFTYVGMNPTSSNHRALWQHMYGLIGRANEILKYVDSSTGWDNDTDKNVCKAEALFFRAFAYRALASFYGDVPLVTEAVSTPRTEFTRTPVDSVYLQIIADLQYGIANLPNPGSEAAPGRITKGAAQNLLCEVYLATGDYDKAIEAATAVINNYGYKLMTERFGSTNDVFGTGDVFLDLFAFGNQNLSENKEAIWVVQFDANLADTQKNLGPRRYGPRYYSLGNDPSGKKAILGEYLNGSYTGYSDTLSRPVSWSRPVYHVSNGIWSSDWNNDIRNAPHNIKRNFYYQNPNSKWNGKVINFADYGSYSTNGRNQQKDTCNYIFPYWIGKVGDPCHVLTDVARSGGGYTLKDHYEMRLAETYLSRAEAYLQKGDREKAAADINVVRSRAHAKPVAASDVTFDYLLDERSRELFTEEWRDLVLRRIDAHKGLPNEERLFYKRVMKYNDDPTDPGLSMKPYNILWPIPQTEIDATGGLLIQNPGYSE